MGWTSLIWKLLGLKFGDRNTIWGLLFRVTQFSSPFFPLVIHFYIILQKYQPLTDGGGEDGYQWSMALQKKSSSQESISHFGGSE